jgi:Kringle domain
MKPAAEINQWMAVDENYKFLNTDESYNGTVGTTVSGRTCQNWNEQSPHLHPYQHLGSQANYCRNPNSDATLWCYTTDVSQMAEYCTVPPHYSGNYNIHFLVQTLKSSQFQLLHHLLCKHDMIAMHCSTKLEEYKCYFMKRTIITE